MSIRSLAHQVSRRLGFQVSRPRPQLETFLQSRDVDVVFDVGANEGQFGVWLREQGYQGRIVSFEPFTAAYDTLAMRAGRDRKWAVHNVALGEAPGTAPLNVSDFSVFNSFLSVSDLTKAIDARSASHRSQSVTVARLDDFMPEFGGRNCFLKVDTQGFERQVLLGARRSLASLKGVQLELSFVQLYEGEWTVSEAIEDMSAHGFVPAQIHPVLHHPADQQSWLQADFLFRRSEDATAKV